MLLAVATAVVTGSGEGKDKPVTFQGFHSLLKLLLSTLKVTFFFLQQVILGQGGGEDKWRRMEKDNGMGFWVFIVGVRWGRRTRALCPQYLSYCFVTVSPS